MSSVIRVTVVAVRLQPNYELELDQKTFMKMHHLVQRDPKIRLKYPLHFLLLHPQKEFKIFRKCHFSIYVIVKNWMTLLTRHLIFNFSRGLRYKNVLLYKLTKCVYWHKWASLIFVIKSRSYGPYSQHFIFSKLTNGPNKLERFSLSGLSSLV